MRGTNAHTKVVKRQVRVEGQDPFLAEWDEPVQRRRPREQRHRDEFALSYISAQIELANMPLTGNDRRVLLALVTYMEQNKPFRYVTNEISDMLTMKPSNVSLCIRHLKDLGLLIEMDNRKVLLHPKFYWRGDSAERVDALEQVERALEKRRTGEVE